MLSEVDFGDLLKRGNRDLYVRLFRRHYQELLRVAMAICPERDAAEEVVQEAFLTLFKTATDEREKLNYSSVHAFLIRTVTNLAVDRYRRGQSWKKVEDGLLTIVRESETPADAAETGDVTRLFERTLDELPPSQRSCLVLRVVQGYDYETIAEILSIGADSVKTNLARARAKLKLVLADYLEG